MASEARARSDGVDGAGPEATLGAPRYSDFAAGGLLAVAGALLVSLPAALRADSAVFGCWIALWGSTAMVLGPTAGALRTLRPLPPAAWAIPLGALLAAGPLMVFGELLERVTHHRPLGAVTFTLVGVGVLLAAIAVAARLLARARASDSGSRRWRGVVAVAVLVGALSIAAVGVSAIGVFQM